MMDHLTHRRRRRWSFWAAAIVAVAILLIRSGTPDVTSPNSSTRRGPDDVDSGIEASPGKTASASRRGFSSRSSTVAVEATPEEVVGAKLRSFGKTRRRLAHALAQRHGVDVSAAVERFFDAVESGDWEAIDTAFKAINGGDSGASPNVNRPADVLRLWPAIIDAYGAAEQVHDWPAHELLAYGKAILDSLPPGMVYVGGTDNGRWIPALLNDTEDGGRAIVITQNALADSTYLDYVQLQYQGRMETLSEQDGTTAFQKYIEDAVRRLKHDQEFPDEPPQVRPFEDIRMDDGRVDVGGQVAVMSINEILLQRLMEKNPQLTFGLQESFPLAGTYAEARPLGPLMELGTGNEENPFTGEKATQSLEYWQGIARETLENSAAPLSESALKAYSHDIVSSAHLLASHEFDAQAEEAFRLATQFWPESPESIAGLADLLSARGQEDQARAMLQDYLEKYPEQKESLDRIKGSWRAIKPVPITAP